MGTEGRFKWGARWGPKLSTSEKVHAAAQLLSPVLQRSRSWKGSRMRMEKDGGADLVYGFLKLGCITYALLKILH